MATFLAELKRRNVFRVAGIYLAAAWLLAQVAGLLGEWFEWPAPALRFFFIALGIGFPIAVVSAWLFEITPEGVKLTRDVESGDSIRPVTGRKLDRILIGALGALVLMLLADRVFWSNGPQPPVSSSVAVLPFVNLSSDAGQEHFVDGLTEAILNSLESVSGLEVTGRTSSFYYKGKNEDPRAIGETLGVAHLVEGSVGKSGDRLRVNARLIRASSGGQVWSQSYERTLDDIFAIQDDIARSVTETLEVSLGVGELGRLPGMTRDAAAYEAYLEAGRVWEATAESVQRAIDYLERAVKLDATFALAWNELANVYSWASTFPLAGETTEGWAAKADAAIAELERLLPGAQLTRARLADRSLNAFEWNDAARHLAGGDEMAVAPLLLLAVGRSSEAAPLLERYKIKDPLDASMAFFLATAYANNGDLRAAIVEQDRAYALGWFGRVSNPITLWAALASHERVLIDERLDRLVREAPDGLDAAIRPLLDRPAEALDELRRLESGIGAADMLPAAFWHAYLGDPNGALEIIRAQLRPSRRTAIFFIWHPALRDMRRLPAFKQFALDLGFVDYWREHGWADTCGPVGEDDFQCI